MSQNSPKKKKKKKKDNENCVKNKIGLCPCIPFTVLPT